MNAAVIPLQTLSLFFALAAPLASLLLLKLRYGAYIKTFVVGASGYLLFGGILMSMLSSVVLPLLGEGSWAGLLYLAATSAVVGQLALLFCFSFVLRDDMRQGLKTPLALGAGFGGAQAILLAVNTLYPLLTVTMTLSSYGTEGALELAAGQGATAEELSLLEETFAELTGTPPFLYLTMGLQQLLWMAVLMSAAVLLYPAATGKGPKWLIPAAMGLHLACGLPGLLTATGVIGETWVGLALFALLAAGSVPAARRAWKAYGEGPLTRRPPREFTGYRLGR